MRQLDYEPGARGPLAGVRVLDMSRLFAGNLLTQQLADFGAEVVRSSNSSAARAASR